MFTKKGGHGGGGGDLVGYLNLFHFYTGFDRDWSFSEYRCLKHGP